MIFNGVGKTRVDSPDNFKVITVRETKFFKSRLVPYNDDLGKVFRRYREQQWEGWKQSEESTFLSCRYREPIKHQTARLVFYRMRAEAEVWRRPVSGARLRG